MSRRSMVILIALIIILSAALILRPDGGSAPGQAAPILPGLAAALDNVSQVTILGPAKTTVATLERGPDTWTVAERDHYPADIGRLRSYVTGLADATIVEEKTAEPQHYARLGVSDIALPDATGQEIDIAAGDKSFRLIVGKTGVRGKQAYARRPGEAHAYLIAADLDQGDSAADWLRKPLLDIDTGRIRQFTITQPDGTTLRAEKASPDDANFVLAGAANGETLQYETILNPVAGVLAGLELEDVARAGAEDSGDAAIVARFETFDGLIVTARTTGDGLARRVRFTASATDDAQQKVRAEATKLREKLSGWTFMLPEFRLDQLTRQPDDVIATSG